MHTTRLPFTASYLSRSRGGFASGKSALRTVAFWLSLVLIFMIPWENMIEIGDKGTTGARAAGLIVGAFWIFTVVIMGRFRKPHPFHVAIFLFVMWNALSALWSLNVDATLVRILTYAQLTVLILILWDLYTSPSALRAGLQAYVLGAYVAIGSLLTNYIAAGQMANQRFSAAGFNENELGVILALGIPVAWHLAASGSNSGMLRVLRLANYAYIPAAALAVLLTASRGALLATIPAFIYVLGSLPRLKPILRVFAIAALVSALFALQSLVPQWSLQRLASTGTSVAEIDLGGRVEIWRQGMASFFEHPVLGIGSGAFHEIVSSGQSAHNTFLAVLAEVGLVGFVLFTFILAITLHQAVRQPKWDSRLWISVLLILAIGVSSMTLEYKKQTWLLMSYVVIAASFSDRRRSFMSV